MPIFSSTLATFFFALYRLDGLPVNDDLLGANIRSVAEQFHLAFGKHVGMTPNQFAGYGIGHIGKVKMTFLTGNLCIEGYLKQQISKFIFQIHHVTTLDCTHDFVGFFQRVRRQRTYRLLEIPGTSVLSITQHICHTDQFFDG